jgi:hypothetical protein
MIPAYAQNAQQTPGVFNGYQWGQWGQTTAPMPQAQPSGIDGVAFVQGENAALAYVVPAGKTYLLIDTIEDRIYFKSADVYGRPSPLNDFWLTKDKPEAKPAPAPAEPETPEWATKADVDELRAQIEALTAKKAPGKSKKEPETEDE